MLLLRRGLELTEAQLADALIAEALAEEDYSKLSPAHRLALLSALCGAWLSCWTAQTLLRTDGGKQQEQIAAFARRSAESELL